MLNQAQFKIPEILRWGQLEVDFEKNVIKPIST